MKYIYCLALTLFFKLSFAFEVAIDLKPIYMLVSDIVNGSGTIVYLIKQSENDIHDHGTGWKPSEITKIGKSDLIISIDLNRYKNFNVKNILNLASGVHLLKNRGSSNDDIHFWLDPSNAIYMANNIAIKLAELDTKNANIYLQNTKLLKKSINLKIAEIKKDIGKNPIPKADYLVLHDAYQYFESYFGITKPIGYFYDGNHNTAGLESMQYYIKKINNGDIKCIMINTVVSKTIERFKSKTKIVYVSPIGEGMCHGSCSYINLLDFVYRGYKECLE